jgi:hypothetical protein
MIFVIAAAPCRPPSLTAINCGRQFNAATFDNASVVEFNVVQRTTNPKTTLLDTTPYVSAAARQSMQPRAVLSLPGDDGLAGDDA